MKSNKQIQAEIERLETIKAEAKLTAQPTKAEARLFGKTRDRLDRMHRKDMETFKAFVKPLKLRVRLMKLKHPGLIKLPGEIKGSLRYFSECNQAPNIRANNFKNFCEKHFI